MMASVQGSLALAKFPSSSFPSTAPKIFNFLHPFPSTTLTATLSLFSSTLTTPKRVSSLVAKASSTTAYPQDIADVLADVTIFTATGQPVKFHDLWDQNEVRIASSVS